MSAMHLCVYVCKSIYAYLCFQTLFTVVVADVVALYSTFLCKNLNPASAACAAQLDRFCNTEFSSREYQHFLLSAHKKRVPKAIKPTPAKGAKILGKYGAAEYKIDRQNNAEQVNSTKKINKIRCEALRHQRSACTDKQLARACVSIIFVD